MAEAQIQQRETARRILWDWKGAELLPMPLLDELVDRISAALSRVSASVAPVVDNDLISRKVAVEIADARLKDVPDTVDLEADRSLFAAGYLAAAGGIKASLERAAPASTVDIRDKTERAKCANCAESIIREGNEWDHEYPYKPECLNPVPTTTPPSTRAKAAAQTIYHEMFKLGGLDEESVVNQIAAIIERCFSTEGEDTK